MNDILFLVAALIAGCALGLIFFGGLWVTIKKSVNSKTPALWFALSTLVRTAIVLPGFYYVSSGSWQRLLLCLLGFISGRFMVFYFTKSHENNTKNYRFSFSIRRNLSRQAGRNKDEVIKKGVFSGDHEAKRVYLNKKVGHES